MAAKVGFEGRVAVVTGAGQGLGREYAMALAARGAQVVVNDLGTGAGGSGSSSGPADTVVAEIEKAGGKAVANYDSVEDGANIIKTAIDSFGRVDIVVNNAGILRDVSFKKMTDNDWDLIYRVHMKGTYTVTRAAWPHFLKQGYGRVVNISSVAGLFGNHGQANYSAMKRGIIGLTLTLAREGLRSNIKANAIAPLAASRMLETVLPKDALNKLSPKPVAQLVAYLSSEVCKPTGSVFEIGGQWIAKLRWQRSQGVKFEGSLSADDVAERYDDIADFSEGSQFPEDSMSSFDNALSLSASAKSKL
mmetsp:Transcript_58189/g.151618  ORF Transcript_58189/g.151618 Transcript_58189/m.151618 type:complete len:305 (-) Transcript_58189:108-1022(-)